MVEGPVGHLDLERGDAYGRSFGDVYDRWYDGVTDAEATADFVTARHPGGPILELGVGTGRLARPLAHRGLAVVGLDASAEMLAACPRTDTEPTSATVHPVLADMRALPFAPGRRRFGSILIAFNTLFNLAEAADQEGLLVELVDLVDRRGTVIVEMLDVSALLDGPDRSIGLRGQPEAGASKPVVVTATQLDRAGQRLNGQHLELTDDGATIRPWRLRWVTPDQLDTMAAAAGLDLAERVGSWDGAPSSAEGTTVISVYRRARR